MGYPLYQPQFPQMMPQSMAMQTPQYNNNDNLTWVTGEAENGESYRGGSREYRGSRDYDGSYDGYAYDGMSYARGHGRNARRDSMGRYADGRSYGKQEMMQEIEEMKRKVEEMD